jgi:pilus assembly protein FimV
MTRKLAMLLLAVGLGFGHGTVHALGLGEIAVESALDQPFEATIQLRNVGSLEPNEVIVNLASAEDFERVGVERFFFLSRLQFETDLSDPGRPRVHVTSRDSITEPFVNFVVEVLWPSGRLLREYTVLLDPPTYGEGTAGSAQVPIGSRADRAQTPAPEPARERSSVAEPDSGPVATGGDGEGSLDGDRYGVTGRNDTLWAIAAEARPGGVSVQQTMLALLRTNPEAFIGGNINQLKAGYVLRIPGGEEIERLSFQDAVVQVSEHNERWRQGLDREPLDARDRDSGVGSDPDTGGELRLVAGESGSSETPGSAAGATGGGAGADPAELREARSRLESAESTNEALESRLEDTRSRVDELERELQLKNEQLARAQQALKAEMEAEPSAPAPQASTDRSTGGLFGLSWMMIGALVAGLALLGAVAMMLTRRRGGEADTDADVDADVERTQLMPAISSEELGDTAGESGGGADDAIGEADVYMVYGRFSEAARVLASAIDADPHRSDIRLKLLEVYAESGDVEGFNDQIRELAEVADSQTIETADRIAARLPGAVTSGGDVTEGDRGSAPARDTAEGEMSLDFDLADDGDQDREGGADLDSLDIDLEPGSSEARRSDDDSGFDLDLDDDAGRSGSDDVGLPDDDTGLSIDGDDPEPTTGEADRKSEADDGELPDIDFALDLDGDEEAGEPKAGSSTAAEGDDDLDLDLDFDLPGDRDTEGDDKAGGQGGDDFASTMLMDSNAVKSALEQSDAEDEERASGGDESTADSETDADPGDLEFDIDELADTEADSVAAGPAESPADESTGGKASAGDESTDLDDFEFDIDELPDSSDSSEDEDDDEDDGSLSLADLEADSDGDALLGLGEESSEDRSSGTSAETDDERTLLSSDGDGDDLDFDLDGDDFDFGSDDDADEISTKLEVARAYVDMGDDDGAREILDEVVRDGDDDQKKDAEELLSKLS